MKYVLSSSIHYNAEVSQIVEDAKPEIDQAAKSLESKLAQLEQEFESKKRQAYDEYIDKCTKIAYIASFNTDLPDASSKEYVYKVLSDYANI